MSESPNKISFDTVELAVFSGRLNSICEEMGYVLKRTALSPNIKDRLDFSCAFFDVEGHICAQAAHIPVHLGSMAYAMSGLVAREEWKEGDLLILNDPFLGGTHLPDVTVVSPFFYRGELLGFFANRAHHANIGASSPGSMPISKDIGEEGELISPCKLYVAGDLVGSVAKRLSRIEGGEGEEIPGDFLAQVSANKTGETRLTEWLGSVFNGDSGQYLRSGLEAVNGYGKDIALKAISGIPKGRASFTDYMDGDGFDNQQIAICVNLYVHETGIEVDFSGTDQQVSGNINCPISVSAASVYYVFACLLPTYAPHCHGVFQAVTISAPEGTLLNAKPYAAVAAGNVETSMRIVDAMLGALAKLGVDVPGAAQGTMNNVALGGRSAKKWDYYETIGGGMGASSLSDGLSAVQCHLTNTLNTPVESLEMHYPLRIKEYSVRNNSGGLGKYRGGDGIVRAYSFVEPTSITLLTERRKNAPWSANGGDSGLAGINFLNGREVPEKVSLEAKVGDVLEVITPGGGGWGR